MKRKWLVRGWILALVTAIAWCGVVIGLGSAWQNNWTIRVPYGTSWSAWDFDLTAKSITQVTELDVGSDPLQPIQGAVFVVVTLTFSQSSSLSYLCMVSLVGDGRDWLSSGDSWMLQRAIPGVQTSCNSKDNENNPITSGVVAKLFEIPESALPEIQGVRVTISDPRQDITEIQTLFLYPSKKAVLEITLD